MMTWGAVSISVCRFLSDKESAVYLQYRQLVEKFRTEMKSTNRSENTLNSEVKDDRVACERQEQNEYGPISFQPESTTTIKREQAVDKTSVKQEDVRTGRQDQEDDNSHQSEGIYNFNLPPALNILLVFSSFNVRYVFTS
jgi:hypothetical protein